MAAAAHIPFVAEGHEASCPDGRCFDLFTRQATVIEERQECIPVAYDARGVELAACQTQHPIAPAGCQADPVILAGVTPSGTCNLCRSGLDIE